MLRGTLITFRSKCVLIRVVKMLTGFIIATLLWYDRIVHGVLTASVFRWAPGLQEEYEAGVKSFAHFWELHGAFTTTSLLFAVVLVVSLFVLLYKHKARNAELQELNRALKNAQQRAEESDRLKTSILQNMSHEIRTPLNAIMGYADLIATGAGDAPQMASRISASGCRLKQTLQTVMELAALEGGMVAQERQLFNLNELVRETLSAVLHGAEEGSVSLETQFESTCVEIYTDPQIVRRALTQIVQNALQFTEAGSVQVQVNADTTHASIVVRDSGIGMSPAFLHRACEPFTQESTGMGRKYEGTGLGLSIASQLIVLLDGQLSISSKPAQGSTFTIKLPLLKRPDDGKQNPATFSGGDALKLSG